MLAAAALPPPPTKTQAGVTSGHPTGTGRGLPGRECFWKSALFSRPLTIPGCVMPRLCLSSSLPQFLVFLAEYRHFFLRLPQGTQDSCYLYSRFLMFCASPSQAAYYQAYALPDLVLKAISDLLLLNFSKYSTLYGKFSTLLLLIYFRLHRHG